jgi:YebC/PmpR family DNA-binding regulatory protein
MGRIFEKRKERMFARWAKNAKAFTKLGKEIAIAIKLGGGDSKGNPRLRMAITTAKSLNMPKDRIDAAIKRAVSKDAENIEELIYEGYAPHSVALIIACATDNPTRTVANIRSILNRHNGVLATSGAVTYQFAHRGFINLTDEELDEELELKLIDSGLEDVFAGEEGLALYSSFNDFGQLQKAAEELNLSIKGAGLTYEPQNLINLEGEERLEVETLIEAIEEDDDVQHVYSNLG